MKLDQVRELAKTLVETGATKKTIELPNAVWSPVDLPDQNELASDFIFDKMIVEPEIYKVSRDLFVGQFYSNAVQEAFTALDNFVKSKAGRKSESGVSLMRTAFSPKKPLLKLNQLQSRSELDEQHGYMDLFAGAMMGIRNPVSHEHQWIDDRETALECLIFCQHLLKKAKRSTD